MHRTQHSRHIQAGFTLVEALVAVLILSASLVAITSLLTRTLQATFLSQEYLIASKLAQEATEMVRAKRNNNLLAENPWNQNLIGMWEFEAQDASSVGDNILASGVPLADAQAPADAFPSSPVPEALHRFYIYNATAGAGKAGKYTYVDNATTDVVSGNFKRRVSVTAIGAPSHSAAVTAEVWWGNGYLKLSSILYDAS